MQFFVFLFVSCPVFSHFFYFFLKNRNINFARTIHNTKKYDSFFLCGVCIFACVVVPPLQPLLNLDGSRSDKIIHTKETYL